MEADSRREGSREVQAGGTQSERCGRCDSAARDEASSGGPIADTGKRARKNARNSQTIKTMKTKERKKQVPAGTGNARREGDSCAEVEREEANIL